MTLRKLLLVYIPELSWPIIVFFASVILPLSLFLVTLHQSPLAVSHVFEIANAKRKVLDVLLMVVPLAFLYQFVGMRLCVTILRSGIEHAEGVMFWFVILPCLFLLGFNLLIAFYFSAMRDAALPGGDLAFALASAWAAFLSLVWFEVGVAIGRIIELSPQPASRP